ncbi:MAG: ATP-binding cassette domain-containing protein [Geobacteraceae bacterium]|nr:ATP-binding cassette domain-containing protein [Geobacteraceae bacterium]
MLDTAIRKTFPGITVEVEFSLENGILVLFGPSGSGKTTILNCISGLLKPDEGHVSLGEKLFFSSKQAVNIPVRKRRIGYVFQEYALFPHLTVMENTLYGVQERCKNGKGSRVEVRDLLEMLKIGHLHNRYPANLSGGEKQRVALARALMVEPELLLLDEPLSALDFANRRELRLELKQLQKTWNIPFLLVTHSREEMKALADEVLFMERGKRCGRLQAMPGPIELEKAV